MICRFFEEHKGARCVRASAAWMVVSEESVRNERAPRLNTYSTEETRIPRYRKIRPMERREDPGWSDEKALCLIDAYRVREVL